MSLLRDLLTIVQNKSSNIQLIQPQTNNGNIDLSRSIFANEVHNHFYNCDRNGGNDYQSIVGDESSIALREAILPIEALINKGMFITAINKYEELISSPTFFDYSKNEKFLIYNGLLNCFINDDAPDDTIQQWSYKIEALGNDIDELHRYYYILGVREYNKRNFSKSLIYLGQSLKINDNYISAIASEILVKVTIGSLSYSEAKERFNELLSEKGMNIKEHATIHSYYGDVAYNSKDFIVAQQHYRKSNDYIEALSKEIGVAICQYYISFKEPPNNVRVEFNEIDFDFLIQSEAQFNKIYSEKTIETTRLIARFILPHYISVLAILAKHDIILQIYEETIEHVDCTNIEMLRNVIHAQILNGIFDKDLISRFDSCEQIKFEALFYDQQHDYDKLVETLTPLFETEDGNDKGVRLLYLIALQKLNQFKKYMHYYHKFLAHNDDAMRLNLIHFLLNRDDMKAALREINELMQFVKNSFVIYDLLLLFLKHDLKEEIRELFFRIDNGEHKIIGLHKSFFFFQKMLFLLNTNQYEEYYNIYESTDLSFLEDNHRLILRLNYFASKGDYDKLATTHYEYFRYNKNHNELLKAIQIKLQINQIPDARFYLDQIDPTLLDKPEIYYIYKSLILKEENKIDEAFSELEYAKSLNLSLDSPFHQFYTAFCFNNNKTENAIKYMGEYYAVNPNPGWFKLIQHFENDSGSDILNRIIEATGGPRDLSFINRLYNSGSIGVSVYCKVVGFSVYEIIQRKNYPYTKVPVSTGNINEARSKMENIDVEIIVDSTTLILLAAVESLNILAEFKKIIIPYSSLIELAKKKENYGKNTINDVIEFIGTTPQIEKLSIDETLKIKNESTDIFYEDTLDCLILSRSLKVPFLNTEVALQNVYRDENIIDINTLLLYFKEKHNDIRSDISELICMLRKSRYEFISFDSEDMLQQYLKHGIVGLTPFLRMGKNADYNSFASVYCAFLNLIKTNYPDALKICSVEIIKFLDRYIRKTIYYASEVCIDYPDVSDQMDELLSAPSARKIILKRIQFERADSNEYSQVKKSISFNKIVNIAMCFITFGIQFISLFNDSPESKIEYIKLFKNSVEVNGEKDVELILYYLNLAQHNNEISHRSEQ